MEHSSGYTIHGYLLHMNEHISHVLNHVSTCDHVLHEEVIFIFNFNFVKILDYNIHVK